MINHFYFLAAGLILAGIREVLIMPTPVDQEAFPRLLGDGSQFGVSIQYAAQAHPNGIAEAFIIGSEFVGNDLVALVLGDDIFGSSAESVGTNPLKTEFASANDGIFERKHQGWKSLSV